MSHPNRVGPNRVGPIHVGVGGWTFEPWNSTFYPPGLPAKRQLEYASSKLTAVEVNGTFYRSMSPAAYARWRDETAPGFMFSIKAHRYAVTRKTKDEMDSAVSWFIRTGLSELGERLGPINWQFAESRKFEPEYFEAFLSVLPREIGGERARHALEVRHSSFDDPRFFDLLRKHGATVIWADDEDWPKLRHADADFAVARVMRSRSDEEEGYTKGEIAGYAKTFSEWAKKQDVFAFFISGAKERNPAAAMALQDALGIAPQAGEAAVKPAAKAAPKPVKKTAAKSDKPAAAPAAKKAPAKKAPAKKAAAKKTVPKDAAKTAARKPAAKKSPPDAKPRGKG